MSDERRQQHVRFDMIAASPDGLYGLDGDGRVWRFVDDDFQEGSGYWLQLSDDARFR
jgi:hypothetical protein